MPHRTTDDLYQRALFLDRQGRDIPSRNAYLAVLVREPNHAGALAHFGGLLFRGGYTSAALTVFSQAVAAYPDDAAAKVKLANVLRQAGQDDAARAAYAAALVRDPDSAEAHQGLAYLLEGRDDEAADRHRALGFTGRVVTTAPFRGTGRPIEVLQLVSAHGGNIPTAAILDDRTCLVHSVVAEFADAGLQLPRHDVVFNAIGDADRCSSGLAAAEKLLERCRRGVINVPKYVLATTRVENARRLGALAGVIAPRAALVARADLAPGAPAGFSVPFLLRSPGFHTGQHFVRVDRVADLGEVMAGLPGDPLIVLQYVDASWVDGAARKYRVMFIGGAMLPLHLAISNEWKVHYYAAGMQARADHRAEEARFLADMPGVLGAVAMRALGEVQTLLRLDYCGIDFAIAADRRIIAFEANATMILAAPAAGAMWDYRRPAFERALAAVRGLVNPRNTDNYANAH